VTDKLTRTRILLRDLNEARKRGGTSEEVRKLDQMIRETEMLYFALELEEIKGAS